MSEVWLVVTLCLAATTTDSPYGQPAIGLTYECKEYRSEASFTTIEDCVVQQRLLSAIPIEGRRVTASLCTAMLSPERAAALPPLRSALGARA